MAVDYFVIFNSQYCFQEIRAILVALLLQICLGFSRVLEPLLLSVEPQSIVPKITLIGVGLADDNKKLF